MKNLEVLNRAQVGNETQQVFDELKNKVGMVPNIYATAANSHYALTALLNLGETLKKGEFSDKEVEAVALAVAEENNCKYCLSAHTAVGKMVGFSEEETLKLRSGEIENEKLYTLTTLAREITGKRGYPNQESVEDFFKAGYNKAALAELIGLVALNTFTNYTNHIAGTPIDFPEARVLEKQA